jgi:MFS family permease
MIGEFDITQGDPSKVGYYVGLMVCFPVSISHRAERVQVSLFFVSEAVTVLWWSRLSDRIGRKPVLIIGLSALAISMVLMGLSTSFWPLVLSRMLCGAMNGNTGVAKSALGEITDSTNVAQAFALMPCVEFIPPLIQLTHVGTRISWAVGVTIAYVNLTSTSMRNVLTPCQAVHGRHATASRRTFSFILRYALLEKISVLPSVSLRRRVFVCVHDRHTGVLQRSAYWMTVQP